MRTPRLDLQSRPFDGVEIRRTEGGVAEIRGRDDLDLARGLGFAHAHDRMVQMMLVRLIGEGRLSECLQASDETLEVDLFARDMGFARDAAADVANLSPAARALADAYCAGVNGYLAAHLPPPELLLAGYRPAPWGPRDILVTIKVMAYVGLAQSQQDLEKVLVQAIHGGVDPARLRALFRPHLDGLDDALVALLRRVHVAQGVLPDAVRFLAAAPKLKASNNWAVAAARSATGSALQCNDPHLEVNRLPAIWYEWVGLLPDDYRMGASMPGLPGLVMGRTRALSAGFTYGFMDMVDYFVEDVRDGRARRDGAAAPEPVDERTETILRKGHPPVELRVRETSHGVLEADGRRPLEDGLYLARAWSGHRGGAAPSLDGLAALLGARDVAEAQTAVRGVTISCNWLLADRGGRIAFQQSGRLPARRHSGLHPVPGWDPALAWDGYVDPARLSAAIDPPDSILVTANDDVDLPGHPRAINCSMGAYRAGRIRALLAARDRHGLEDMKRIQRDLHSPQAERFMSHWRPLLPPTETARVLAAWDLAYDAASRGAPLFERAYAAVLREVFGAGLFGVRAWDALAESTSLLADYFHVFDTALLGDDPSWFGDEGRDPLFRRVLTATLRDGPPLRTWGEERRVVMTNVFFAGKLPRWLGFDHGPITLEGNRSTVVQGAIFRAHGRATSFCPSWRYVTDLGRDEVHTALAGGPSGNRLSPYYVTDVERWLDYGYKTLRRS